MQELRRDEGQTTGMTTSNGGTSGLDFDEIVSNSSHLNASSTKRSRTMLEFDLGDAFVNNNALHQQERSLSAAIPQSFPSFVGELERDLQAQESVFPVSQNTLHSELFHPLGNMENGTNYGSFFSITSPTAEATVTSLVNGNYHPTSNLSPQLHGDSSSTLKLSSTQNQNLAANGAAASYFPRTQWTSYPNFQKPHSQLSTGLEAIPEMVQLGGLSSFSYGRSGRSSNESLFLNTRKHGHRGNLYPIPSLREMGEPSSRNVKMKMTMSDNSQTSTELHVSSLLNPITQSNGNSQPPRLMSNSLYDPIYEKRGLPVDPILRTFLLGREAYMM
ncbi:hypothetical protein LR48_Vigan845s005400 [Vigna angularis]|uniref:Uncharacterized protein n=2 Tax=Phaseolus angularis TaxID=3914 RepID=A0A0L9THU0_PHAAN|nr:hypothetical protein LR48_Vigan845s005400 [Vigna angularis]